MLASCSFSIISRFIFSRVHPRRDHCLPGDCQDSYDVENLDAPQDMAFSLISPRWPRCGRLEVVPTVAAFQGGLVTASGWLQRFQSFVMLYISSNALRCVCVYIMYTHFSSFYSQVTVVLYSTTLTDCCRSRFTCHDVSFLSECMHIYIITYIYIHTFMSVSMQAISLGVHWLLLSYEMCAFGDTTWARAFTISTL